ncbi:hypothetical protein MASR2M117_19620 [Paludibacter sp.]
MLQNKYTLTIICIILHLNFLSSQEYQFIGDTIEIEMNGYKGGIVQWQQSLDKVNWTDIPGSNKVKQDIIIKQKGYFRAKVTNCEELSYSDTTTFTIYNKPLKIGVFGGSISSTPESETAKKIWLDTLSREFFSVETKGVGGAGFSSLTKYSVPNQIRLAKPYDIYVLWASTNDYYSKAPVGDYSTNDTTTMIGGIKYAINIIKQKNEDALIVFFTSLPFYYKDDNFPIYVSNQKKFCEINNIPVLDQNTIFGISYLNPSQEVYFTSDKTHVSNEGYAYIGPMQAQFLKKEILRFFFKKF